MKNTTRRKFVQWLAKLPLVSWIISSESAVSSSASQAGAGSVVLVIVQIDSDGQAIRELSQQEIHDLRAFFKPRECRESFPEWNGLREGCFEYRDGQWVNWEI